MKTKSQGFTLIELIAVLAIAAILLGIAVPSAIDMIRASGVISMNNDLVADLQFARSEAIKRNVQVTVCASNDGATCAGATNDWDSGWIVFVENVAFDGVLAGGEALLRVGAGSVSDSMTIRTRNDVQHNVAGAVSYLSNGYPVLPPATPATGEFWICENNEIAYSSLIRLNQSGRLSSVGDATQCTN